MMARVLKIGQNHYPESLHKCIIINAPRFFSIAWTVVSMVLHERTRAKTIILSGNGVDTLQAELGCEREAVEALLATNVEGELSDDVKEGRRFLPDEPEHAAAGGAARAPPPAAVSAAPPAPLQSSDPVSLS